MAEESQGSGQLPDGVRADGLDEVNVEQIVERIRRALYVTDAGALVEGSGARDEAPAGSAAPRSLTADFDPELYRCLHQANVLTASGLQVDCELGWKTPIIGHAWMAVRRRIHQEVRIYVDALTAQQSSLNAHLVRALSRLVEGLTSMRLVSHLSKLEEQEEAVRALRDEVAELRERVRRLERERTEASEAR